MLQHIGWDVSRRHVPHLLAADFMLIPVNTELIELLLNQRWENPIK
jgi:hypothetical protein